MADQTAQQSQQQQQNMAPTPTHDERLVACVKRIWKSDQANAERILSNLSNVIGAVQKEQDPVKREGLQVSYPPRPRNLKRDLVFIPWQKKIQSVKNAAILFQQFARQGNSFVPEIAAEVAVHAAMHNTNPSQLYPSTLQRFLQQQQQQQQQGAGQQQQQPQQQEPSRMEGVVATPSWPNKISDPEEHIKMVSKDPAAHMDPGPVAFPALRPTLTGGVPLGIQNGVSRLHPLLLPLLITMIGTPAHILPPPDDPSIYVPDIRPTSLRKNQAAEQHVRKKIQELVSTVDPTVKVDAEAEDVRPLDFAPSLFVSLTPPGSFSWKSRTSLSTPSPISLVASQHTVARRIWMSATSNYIWKCTMGSGFRASPSTHHHNRMLHPVHRATPKRLLGAAEGGARIRREAPRPLPLQGLARLRRGVRGLPPLIRRRRRQDYYEQSLCW